MRFTHTVYLRLVGKFLKLEKKILSRMQKVLIHRIHHRLTGRLVPWYLIQYSRVVSVGMLEAVRG